MKTKLPIKYQLQERLVKAIKQQAKKEERKNIKDIIHKLYKKEYCPHCEAELRESHFCKKCNNRVACGDVVP
jgi:ribosomal protein L33